MLSACGGGGGDAGGSPNSVPRPTASYSIGGSASGIVGPGLVLQLNAGADIAVDVSRDFSFATTLAAGTSYQVTVKSNPVGQVCVVGNGTGVANADVANVAISCTTPVPPGPDSFRLGGTVSGLVGSGMTLENGSQTLTVAAGSTSFVFTNSLSSGTAYQVSVATQPTSPAQNCTVSNGAGTVGSSDITHVAVACVTPPPTPTGGLTIDTSALTFVGEEGQSVAPQALSGSVTGATAPIFVTISFTDKGLYYANFSMTGPTSGQLLVTPRRPADIAPGLYNDTITVKACYEAECTRPVLGSPKTVDVKYTVQAPHPAATLRLSDRGVAFASVPGASQLSRGLIVRDSSGAASGWSAVSDAAWLMVTTSGTSGGMLQLTADPTGLNNGFYQGNVTVRSANPEVATAVTVRVGLYVSTSASASSLSSSLSTPLETIAETTHAVDPIRPLVYSTAGATIAANHVHTGGRESTLTVPGAELGGVAVNDDGSRLYALDYASGSVVVVDLDTMTVLRTYGFPQLQISGEMLRSGRIAYARVHGQAVLLMTGAGRPFDATRPVAAPVFKADTGELVGELFGVSGSEHTRLVVSRDGTTGYVADAGLSGVLSTTRLELRANSLGNVYGKSVAVTTGVNEAALSDLATSGDGSRVWLGYGTDHFVREAVYDGTSLQWTAGLAVFTRPSNVQSNGMGPADIEVDAYGKLFTHDYAYDLRVYGAAGNLDQQWLDVADTTIVSGRSGTMRISSDGLRLIGNGQLLTIRP